jgi:uncharacterized protein
VKNIERPTSNIQHPMPVRARARENWMFSVGCSMLDVPKFILLFAIRIYRLVLSPAQFFLFGGNLGCRFTPTCSAYGLEAIREHGAVAGSILTAKRVCRCQPWGDCGHDPVPKAESGKRKAENILEPAH